MSAISQWFNLFGGGSGGGNIVPIRGVLKSQSSLVLVGQVGENIYRNFEFDIVENRYTASQRYQSANKSSGESKTYTEEFELIVIEELRLPPMGDEPEGELVLQTELDRAGSIPKISAFYDGMGQEVHTDEWRRPDAFGNEYIRDNTSEIDSKAAAIAYVIAYNKTKEQSLSDVMAAYKKGANDPPGVKTMEETVNTDFPDIDPQDPDDPYDPTVGVHMETPQMAIQMPDGESYTDEWDVSWQFTDVPYSETTSASGKSVNYGLIYVTVRSKDGTHSCSGYVKLKSGSTLYTDNYSPQGDPTTVFRPTKIFRRGNSMFVERWVFTNDGTPSMSLGQARVNFQTLYPTVDDAKTGTNGKNVLSNSIFDMVSETSNIPFEDD